ncbi:recombination-associated protein RdgC [Vandammella animalimorsus]|uniref:recombination-associated protein RdgC n=1 Tax=Vandammella animalimorsus TaxID=2029117 RepID=UPI0031BAC367
MMFKNLLMFRVSGDWRPDLGAVELPEFLPCGPTQELSQGWVPPRGHAHGPLIEAVGGQWILRWCTETKVLPADAVQRMVEAKCAAIEAETGRKPGRKERRDIKEEVRLALLPKALTKRHGVWVWIDPGARLLVVDAASLIQADAILTSLVEAMPGLMPRHIQTALPPAVVMAEWLHEQIAPGAFCLGDECELKSIDESRATVRYARHALEIEEIRSHLQAGKRPTKLALGWGERCQFVLTDTLQIKKLAMNDVATEGRDSSEDPFDADVALATGELSQLIQHLLGELKEQV